MAERPARTLAPDTGSPATGGSPRGGDANRALAARDGSETCGAQGRPARVLAVRRSAKALACDAAFAGSARPVRGALAALVVALAQARGPPPSITPAGAPAVSQRSRAASTRIGSNGSTLAHGPAVADEGRKPVSLAPQANTSLARAVADARIMSWTEKKMTAKPKRSARYFGVSLEKSVKKYAWHRACRYRRNERGGEARWAGR